MSEAQTAEKGQPTPKKEAERGRRRILTGRVVNDTEKPGRMQKTVVVEVVRRYRGNQQRRVHHQTLHFLIPCLLSMPPVI